MLYLCLIVDEQDEFVRQISQLKETAAKKDAKMSQMRNELAEMKKITQASTVSANVWQLQKGGPTH